MFDALDDAQVQKMLDCEHGGLNESFAELYGRTGNRRWLALSERIYHRRILEPLSRGEDCLANVHANTQIPKLIGLARLHELTGESRHLKAASFFWETVTDNYSYVIGGNADQEYFQAPRSIAHHITEQTCESCNSYNMMKLTRLLYAQNPSARYFDYYERTHLNHILAQHHPKTGMFAYMVPLMSGTHREFSRPIDDFWCCVGTGMESHAKHGDSIFWTQGNDVIVNLYIPARVELAAAGSRNAARDGLSLCGRYCIDGDGERGEAACGDFSAHSGLVREAQCERERSSVDSPRDRWLPASAAHLEAGRCHSSRSAAQTAARSDPRMIRTRLPCCLGLW